jgi:hypothetical protein
LFRVIEHQKSISLMLLISVISTTLYLSNQLGLSSQDAFATTIVDEHVAATW